MDWTVYLLKCADNSLYCGISNDIKARISMHNAGKGAKYTKSRLPVKLIAERSGLSKSDALKLEYYIKQQPVDKKIEALTNAEFASVNTIKKEIRMVLREISRLHTTLDKLLKRLNS